MDIEEPMDVDSGELIEKIDDLLEEGEYVETNNVETNKVDHKPIEAEVQDGYKNKPSITGIDMFGKEAQEKLEERARRFGLKKDGKKFSIKEAENLYESFGIFDGTESAQNYKLNVIHMQGTEKMTTKDVFKYFEDYAPASIEWINEISCNILWLDKLSAARAILGLSKKIIGIKKNSRHKIHPDDETEEDSEGDVIIKNGHGHKKKIENAINAKDIRCPIPSGIWRKGRDYNDTRDIFLRFATITDKRPHPSEKPALKGILTNSRKRAYKLREPTPPPIIKNGIAAKNPWGSLSKNWGVTDFVEDDYLPKKPIEPVSNVRGRLGYRSRAREDDFENYDSAIIELSDDSVGVQGDSFEEEEDEEVQEEQGESSDEDDWCRRNKMPRMRMHADDEEAKIQKRKGKIRCLVNHRARVTDNSFQGYNDYEIPSNVREVDDLRKDNDLRKRLVAKRRLPPQPPVEQVHKRLIAKRRLTQKLPKLQPDIQVVLTNPKVLQGSFSNIDVTEDEYEDDDNRPSKIVYINDEDDEEEEGEIIDSDSDSKVEIDDEEGEEREEAEEEVEEEVQEENEKIELDSETDTETSDTSSISEKEIQGPKGSVIKVVPRKPKLQSTVSTVWSRLNTSRHARDDSSPERHHSKTDLRHTLKKGDLRSRIGNNHTRGRSPLRIELRNDKYSGRRSDSD